jgi:hypothetical protein
MTKTGLITLHKKPTRLAKALMITFMVGGITFSAVSRGNQEEPPQPRSDDPGSPIEFGESSPSNGEDRTEPANPLLQAPTGAIVAPLDRPAWAIAYHESRDLFQQEVSDVMESGYIPAGMEATEDGRFMILYSVAGSVVPSRWILESYTAAEINEELSARFLTGWSPLAFSVLDGRMYVLLGSGGTEIDAWRIHQTELDTAILQSTISQYQSDGYSIVDISIDPSTDQIWYLFVSQRGRSGGPDSSLFINGYPQGEAMIAGISQDYTDGRGLPFGLASGSEIALVLFDRTNVRTTEQ